MKATFRTKREGAKEKKIKGIRPARQTHNDVLVSLIGQEADWWTQNP
jgi:hypothetical protein